MKFTSGQAVTHGGEAWVVLSSDETTGQYEVQSLDGKRRGWLPEDQVLRAP
jgi:hypothetical protein